MVFCIKYAVNPPSFRGFAPWTPTFDMGVVHVITPSLFFYGSKISKMNVLWNKIK